jgi:hypothetical protein
MKPLIIISFIPLLVLPLMIFFNADKLEVHNQFIPMDITIDGIVYDMEEIDILMQYHGAESIKIVVNRRNNEENGVWFYRDGVRCNLFTDAAISYLKRRIK